MKTQNVLRTLTTASALVLLLGTAASAQGSIEIVGGNTQDWGVVAPAKLNADIQVKNVGDDTLKITAVKPSCGCTAAPIDRSVLAPQEIATIKVTIDMTSRTGPTTKTLTVTSSDPKNPTQIIYLKADVKRALAFSPAEYFLVNNGIVGQESAASLRISNTGENAFTVYPPEFMAGNVQVRIEMNEQRELKPGEEVELKAHITPLEAGSAHGIVMVRTSLAEYSEKQIPVYGSVAAAAPAVPVKPAPSSDAPTIGDAKTSPK